MSSVYSSFEGVIEISDSEFSKIRDLVYSKSGINLTEKKKALVRGRLNRVLRQKGFNTFQEYYEDVVKDDSGAGLLQLVDKISTNHTFFFRESDHFKTLKNDILPRIIDQYKPSSPSDLKIWCAGCATGEEAYTIAMTLRDYFGPSTKWEKPSILATDISSSALSTAVNGEYSLERVEAIPSAFLKRDLRKTDSGTYQVNDDIKNIIAFRRLNFMDEEFPFKKKFHIVFFRNVMIYFDEQTKRRLLQKIHRYMYQESYLFVGHSETLGRDSEYFRYLKPALYAHC